MEVKPLLLTKLGKNFEGNTIWQDSLGYKYSVHWVLISPGIRPIEPTIYRWLGDVRNLEQTHETQN